MQQFENTEERVVSLYDICKVMGIQHSKAKAKAEDIQAKPGFGAVPILDTVNLNGLEVKTYSYTKRQALMIGARLDSSNIIKFVNELEEMEKQTQIIQKTGNPILDALIATQLQIDENKVQMEEAGIELK